MVDWLVVWWLVLMMVRRVGVLLGEIGCDWTRPVSRAVPTAVAGQRTTGRRKATIERKCRQMDWRFVERSTRRYAIPLRSTPAIDSNISPFSAERRRVFANSDGSARICTAQAICAVRKLDI